jgi:hypothetical protein
VAVLWTLKAWVSFFTRPVAAVLVIMLLGVMAGQGRGLMLEADSPGGASWTKTSAKIQLIAVMPGVPALKFTPLAKTQKAAWNEFRSGLPVAAPRQNRIDAPRVVLVAPELPSCPWIGVIVLLV